MKKGFLYIIILFLSLRSMAHSEASDTGMFDTTHVAAHGHEASSGEFNAREIIIEHILDSYDWHVLDWNSHPVSIPLPIILITEGNLDVFMSSSFEHGHANVVKEDREYVLAKEEGKVKKSIQEIHGKKVIDLSITKNAATLMLATFLLIILMTNVAKSYKNGALQPSGAARFIEPLVLFVRDDIAIPNIGEYKYKKYLPYLLTLFFFIWSINLLGLIPFPPGGANVTGNIAVTMLLAISTMVIVNVNANANYWKHIFATPGVPTWLLPIMIPVELIGVISKPFALMIRLFANISAGHIVILSLISLIFIFKTVFASVAAIPMVLFISVLELLVAALQAYIFTLLTALFIGLAVQEEHH